MRQSLILAIDQGTTSTRAIVFDRSGRPVATAQREFRQIYPHDGWVEHDAEEIWDTTVAVCQHALGELGAADASVSVAAIGITNQRETTVVWDREDGRVLGNAIVWQDRRTADTCEALVRRGLEPAVTAKTGLLLDPYFSATKVAWIIDHFEGARAKAESGRLAFGTIDSFLLWRLTGGQLHATDATNASRTLLYNIHDGCWDDELLELFGVPPAMLPEVRDSADDFGTTRAELFGRAITIGGIAGDQQAAAIGQACTAPGMIKSTYGTGCFLLQNTGDRPVRSNHRLLTTIAYQLGGRTSYALEGSIFIAGAAVQWLRDGLGVIDHAAQSEALAASLEDNRGVYLVPAFTGLGAPHWDPRARGAIFGITRDTGPAELARAALESVCYQTYDLLQAMALDRASTSKTLRVDGGMVVNDWLVQQLADLLDIVVERPVVNETTALGAAYLAGIQAGVFAGLEDIGQLWQRDRRFEPDLSAESRAARLAGWHKAVARVREN